VDILIAAVILTGLSVLAALVLVLVGIRDEERHMSLTSAPRTRIGAMTRHLTGVGVRTPEADPCKDQDPDSCPGRHLT
jgi:type II secretory pathway component PulJ